MRAFESKQEVENMKKFYMEIPYTGVLKVEVDAASKEEALQKVYEADRERIYNGEIDDIQWLESEEDYHNKIVEGNVFHGIQNQRVIEEIEDED